jgi:NTE family protein
VSTELASFDQLGVPFRAVATDLVRGDMVVLDRGSLVRAVRASMSVPSGFAPVREQERLLVDGGLSRNLPVDVVRKLCADVVIAVDVGSPLLREDELQSLIGVAAQMVNILIEDNVRRSLAELHSRDLLITPDLGSIGATDFGRGLTGIPAGERAAQLRAPALRALAVPLRPSTEGLAMARRGWNRPPSGSTRSCIAGTRFVNPRVIEAQMRHQAEGVPLNREALHRDIAALMSRGDFSQVNYRIVPEQQASGVLWIQPGEHSLGPNSLLLGIGAAVDSEANTYFNVPVLHTRTWVNALGGARWTSLLQVGRTQRLLTQLMQPAAGARRPPVPAAPAERRDPPARVRP